jgi:hypothetical protein
MLREWIMPMQNESIGNAKNKKRQVPCGYLPCSAVKNG